MKKFYVLLMRDASLLTSHADFSSLQDLQYIAGPVGAHNPTEAAKLAKKELRKADASDGLYYGEVTVIGHITDGVYCPWFNRDVQ